MARRKELVDVLAPLREGALDGHPWASWATAQHAGTEPGTGPDTGPEGRMPGGASRWNAKRDLTWEPLRPELVAEVAFDHLQGDRFRHATQFVRWRTDRQPASCTYAQLDVAVPEELAAVFGA
jgi:hypothetical protein